MKTRREINGFLLGLPIVALVFKPAWGMIADSVAGVPVGHERSVFVSLDEAGQRSSLHQETTGAARVQRQVYDGLRFVDLT